MNASFMETAQALLIPAILLTHSYSCTTMRRATVCCQRNLWKSNGFYHTISHNTDHTQCLTQKKKTLSTNWNERNLGWTLVSAYASFQSFPTAILYQIRVHEKQNDKKQNLISSVPAPYISKAQQNPVCQARSYRQNKHCSFHQKNLRTQRS